jgi:hypothetical protein
MSEPMSPQGIYWHKTPFYVKKRNRNCRRNSQPHYYIKNYFVILRWRVMSENIRSFTVFMLMGATFFPLAKYFLTIADLFLDPR